MTWTAIYIFRFHRQRSPGGYLHLWDSSTRKKKSLRKAGLSNKPQSLERWHYGTVPHSRRHDTCRHWMTGNWCCDWSPTMAPASTAPLTELYTRHAVATGTTAEDLRVLSCWTGRSSRWTLSIHSALLMAAHNDHEFTWSRPLYFRSGQVGCALLLPPMVMVENILRNSQNGVRSAGISSTTTGFNTTKPTTCATSQTSATVSAKR